MFKDALVRYCFLCCFILCSCADSAHDQPEQLILDWTVMWNSYDLNEVDRLFSEDATYFSSERAGLIKGMDALQKHHKGFGFVKGGKDSEAKLWLTETHYTDLDGSILVVAIWHFSRPGADAEQKGPVSFIIIENAAGYVIHHAHFSNDPKTVL